MTSTNTEPKEKRSPRSKEVFTYTAPWPVFGLGCSHRSGPGYQFRFAVGSFIEEYSNKVQIIQVDEKEETDPNSATNTNTATTGSTPPSDFVVKGSFDHPYPTTKIMWAPEALATSKDLLATTGDYLRLWSVYGDGAVRFERLFNNNKNSEYCAPVTSFDWNTADMSMIGTSSIDTTCTIWDINVGKVKTQLIAHDKEVYDIAWTIDRDIFATVGADGSLRMFDMRSLEHSTIMYETQGGPPLLRLSWNTLDTNYIATFAADSNKAVVLDVRMLSAPAAELGGHSAAVNGVMWAPHSACHICTVGDDYQALIWDLSSVPKPVEDPILAYSAEAEISNMTWSPSMCEWVNIALGNKLQALRV